MHINLEKRIGFRREREHDIAERIWDQPPISSIPTSSIPTPGALKRPVNRDLRSHQYTGLTRIAAPYVRPDGFGYATVILSPVLQKNDPFDGSITRSVAAATDGSIVAITTS